MFLQGIFGIFIAKKVLKVLVCVFWLIYKILGFQGPDNDNPENQKKLVKISGTELWITSPQVWFILGFNFQMPEGSNNYTRV